ncbi:hypothetical protein RHMOL_Rhmol12G0067000 [Rhododendron molle]|uniref:Uncharacterized protein n=1 Tax=Rhododendron molle TaxID=49168 RepID=A0ACC0LF73_RHOML|nr:hypothetical protein RHMOL_Rhmol12G0067000 [Rhododendron molle]
MQIPHNFTREYHGREEKPYGLINLNPDSEDIRPLKKEKNPSMRGIRLFIVVSWKDQKDIQALVLILMRLTSRTEYSKKNVCFVMFVDEQTLLELSADGNVPNERGYIGLWRIVIMRNLPYKDMRKTGKMYLKVHSLSGSTELKYKVHSFPLKYNHTTELCIYFLEAQENESRQAILSNMFKDCERRALAKLFSHRPPPPASWNSVGVNSSEDSYVKFQASL